MADEVAETMKIVFDGFNMVYGISKDMSKAAIKVLALMAFAAKGVYGIATQKAAKDILKHSNSLTYLNLNEKDYKKFKSAAKKYGLTFVHFKEGEKGNRTLVLRGEDCAVINRIMQVYGITRLSEDMSQGNDISQAKANDNLPTIEIRTNEKSKETEKSGHVSALENQDGQNIDFEKVDSREELTEEMFRQASAEAPVRNDLLENPSSALAKGENQSEPALDTQKRKAENKINASANDKAFADKMGIDLNKIEVGSSNDPDEPNGKRIGNANNEKPNVKQNIKKSEIAKEKYEQAQQQKEKASEKTNEATKKSPIKKATKNNATIKRIKGKGKGKSL